MVNFFLSLWQRQYSSHLSVKCCGVSDSRKGKRNLYVLLKLTKNREKNILSIYYNSTPSKKQNIFDHPPGMQLNSVL